MTVMHFEVAGQGEVSVQVRHLLNGGYAGRDSAQVQHHIDELAELGVPGPTRIPTLYPLSASLAVQPSDLLDGAVQVAHARTSGEAEWALVVPDSGAVDDILVTAACDHTDRALEVHGVAWSKQSAPDVLGQLAWRWADVRADFDRFSLRAWVGEQLIQDGTAAQLLSPDYWIEQLESADLLRPGTVLMSGTIPMIAGVDQFASSWRVALTSPEGVTSELSYGVQVLPEPWE